MRGAAKGVAGMRKTNKRPDARAGAKLTKNPSYDGKLEEPKKQLAEDKKDELQSAHGVEVCNTRASDGSCERCGMEHTANRASCEACSAVWSPTGDNKLVRPSSFDMETSVPPVSRAGDEDAPRSTTTFESAFEPAFEAEAITSSPTKGVDSDSDVDGGGLEFDEAMLQDLVFAFQACDADGNGYLDAQELLAVIRVLAGPERAQKLSIEVMYALIRQEHAEWASRCEKASGTDTKKGSRMKTKSRKTKPDPSVSTGVNVINGIKRNITVTVTVTLDDAAQDMISSMDSLNSMTSQSSMGSVDSVDSGFGEALDYPMFVSLLTSGRASQFLGEDHDDWEDHAYQLRLLKHAWVRFAPTFGPRFDLSWPKYRLVSG